MQHHFNVTAIEPLTVLESDRNSGEYGEMEWEQR